MKAIWIWSVYKTNGCLFLLNMNYQFHCLLFFRIAIRKEIQPGCLFSFQIATLKKSKQRNRVFRIWFMVMDWCNETDRDLYYHILHSWHSNLPIHRGDYSIFGPPFIIEKAIKRQFHTSLITIITFTTFTVIASCKRKLYNKYGFLTPSYPYTARPPNPPKIINVRSLKSIHQIWYPRSIFPQFVCL